MTSKTDRFEIVTLVNGVRSVRSLTDQETFHPVIGPVAEAEALYVQQLKLESRLRHSTEPFVAWDVGLGAAANALSVFRVAAKACAPIRMISFDRTIEPLAFALHSRLLLGYMDSYEEIVECLIETQTASWVTNGQTASWELVIGDFPTQMSNWPALAAPHAILYDPYSPAKNPAMWTEPLFRQIFHRLNPERPCALATYSRSTMLRVSLLLAGFFVGSGKATGEKEETTIAANRLELIEKPLGADWLRRASVSTSAEPMRKPEYRQVPLSPDTQRALLRHPQFVNDIPGAAFPN